MTDLLIRGIDVERKNALARRAARNGRSQQAEAKLILEEGLKQDARSWIAILRNAGQSAGGIDVEPPVRHAARSTDVEGWL